MRMLLGGGEQALNLPLLLTACSPGLHRPGRP
jgi:hypothetical protein